jgi:lauroyl/myristoyl acyltransferase
LLARGEKVLRFAEGVVYWAVVAPVLARLPSALGYRIACWRGDCMMRWESRKRAQLLRNLPLLLGDELDAAAVRRVTRDWFRYASCEAVDIRQQRRGVAPLRRLVEIRGREHLEAALAGGKGAILCLGHFGSYDSGLSVLYASGFEITVIGRPTRGYTAERTSAERWFWNRFYLRPTWRHRQRPNIEPRPGQIMAAVQAATVLRANEVVTVSIDVPPLDADLARTIEVPFLGGQARLVPGVVTLAQVSGAPVLVASLYRSADYRHQVWEISAPVPMDGDTPTAFGRCAGQVSDAIRTSPASWEFWASPGGLARLGLIAPDDRSAGAAQSLVG